MTGQASSIETDKEIIARLDGLDRWPYRREVLLVVGVGYLVAFFDITNVAFGLPIFTKELHFTPSQIALPITAGLIGFVVGSWINSNIADAYGRRLGIGIATVLFTLGCCFTAFTNSAEVLIGGRFITGMGTGAEIVAVSAYISELAPAGVRGRYVSLANVFAMVGQGVVPIFALWLVPNYSWGWRAMFLLGAIGGLTLAWLPTIPESPRWLLTKGKIDEARSIVREAERSIGRIGHGSLPISELCSEDKDHAIPLATVLRPPFLGRTMLLFGIWFVWYVGAYTWLGLGPTFFVEDGYTLTSSILFMIMSSLGYPLGAALAALLGDKFERKRSIMVGMSVWTACFILLAFSPPSGLIYASVFALSCSLGFFLPLLYALSAESFPTKGRATGIALTDGAGHIGGAVGPIAALQLDQLAGTHGFFSVFLFMAFTGFVVVCLLPFSIAATGKSLEGKRTAL